MENCCDNTVTFKGDPNSLKQIKELFSSMAEKEIVEDEGQLPDFVRDTNRGHIFDILQFENIINIFLYETKDTPNTEVVMQIAERFKVDFTLEYYEVEGREYGKVIFENGVLTDIRLDHHDFDSFEINKEAYTYYFEGKEYSSVYDILNILLERKIENHFNNINTQNNDSIS